MKNKENEVIQEKITLKEKLSLKIRKSWLANQTVTILLILILFFFKISLNLNK